jgi:MarR family 2-MHQ and catechol resistance regulon transcriptional repressor
MEETENEEDASGVHVWLVLWKATHSLEAHARRSIEALDLCMSDFAVLEVLLHKGPLPVNVIGRKVLLTSGSITTAVDRLEKQQLVERRDHPEDRRARVVHLTAGGKKLIQKAFANHELDMEQAASALGIPERKTLLRLLKRLGQGAGRPR